MFPFVVWVKHQPCLMPSQSHCSHRESHSTPLPALQQLAQWCHLKLSAVAVAYHRLDQQLSGTAATLNCYIISRLEHQETRVRMKRMAFRVFCCSLTSLLWINTEYESSSKISHQSYISLAYLRYGNRD